MNTPLPTASTAIAVTKRRCSPTLGNPSRCNMHPLSWVDREGTASGYRTGASEASLGRMTFSIVARSDDGESWGVAVTSKFLAVGSAVPAAVAGVGAIATQADANVAYKGLALAHLDTGATASEVVQALIEQDEGRDHRQVGVVDAGGGAASTPATSAWTGPGA